MVTGFKFKQSEIGVFNSNAIEVVNCINPGCRILGLTQGKYSLIDLIYQILQKVGKSDVICTTWSAGIKDANQVRWMLNTDLIESFKIITDHSYATRQKKYAGALDELFGKENIRTSEIHAKFTLISNENWKIVIRTSMNLNANKTCENFEIDDNQEIYDFYMNFINNTFENFESGFVSNAHQVNKHVDAFFAKNQRNSFQNQWANDLKKHTDIFKTE